MLNNPAERALIVVDPQYDFMPGGSLAVKDGDQIVPVVNKLIDHLSGQTVIVFTRDWHPAETSHFAQWGGMWPPHCVQGTNGAKFHEGLKFDPEKHFLVSKATQKDEDAYSGFQGRVEDGRTLEEVLRDSGVRHVYIVGLATDYCVKSTALDAKKIPSFSSVTVLLRGCRAVNVNKGDDKKAIKEMEAAGINVTSDAWFTHDV